MKTDLAEIWEMQNTIDEIVAQKYELLYPQHVDDCEENDEVREDLLNNWIIQMVNCIHSEAEELKNEANWKHWKPPKPIDREKAKGETIDLAFFVFSMALKLEMSPEEFLERYKNKLEENINRQHGKSKEGKNYGTK